MPSISWKLSSVSKKLSSFAEVVIVAQTPNNVRVQLLLNELPLNGVHAYDYVRT